MLNCIPITLSKGTDKKKFYLFPNGLARDVTNGFGELVSYKEIYSKLIADGYTEEISIKKTRHIRR